MCYVPHMTTFVTKSGAHCDTYIYQKTEMNKTNASNKCIQYWKAFTVLFSTQILNALSSKWLDWCDAVLITGNKADSIRQWYKDGAGNTTPENSSVFSLILMCWFIKLCSNWGCRLTQVVCTIAVKTVVVDSISSQLPASSDMLMQTHGMIWHWQRRSEVHWTSFVSTCLY